MWLTSTPAGYRFCIKRRENVRLLAADMALVLILAGVTSHHTHYAEKTALELLKCGKNKKERVGGWRRVESLFSLSRCSTATA